MSKLIVCLGYSLKPDNSVHSVLENRLIDVVNLCKQNVGFTLLLMGSSRYGDLRQDKISEASAMKDYLDKKFRKALEGVKIITEETTQSTVEQLCYLKKFLEREKINLADLVIVSSEFFSERVKLYAEYIFGTIDGVTFIGSSIPTEMVENFKRAEGHKIAEGKKWLKDIRKGDDEGILKEQKAFQSGVLKGEIKQPPIS